MDQPILVLPAQIPQRDVAALTAFIGDSLVRRRFPFNLPRHASHGDAFRQRTEDLSAGFFPLPPHDTLSSGRVSWKLRTLSFRWRSAMIFTCPIRFEFAGLLLLAAVAATSAWAEEPSPAAVAEATRVMGKGGLAAQYPGDEGIERDPRVLFVDDFETGTVNESFWLHLIPFPPQQTAATSPQSMQAPPVIRVRVEQSPAKLGDRKCREHER
jgi:hypothetical protein